MEKKKIKLLAIQMGSVIDDKDANIEKVKKLLEILDKAKKTVAYYDFCNWLLNDKNRRQYLKTIKNNCFFEDYLTIEYFLQTGEVKAISDYNRAEALDMIAPEWAEEEGVELVGV